MKKHPGKFMNPVWKFIYETWYLAMTNLLEINNLVKKYGNITAVNDISFSIQQGICLGILGPNGAGKTTTIEIIEDIITPDSGEILFRGKSRSSGFKEKIGIQFQETALLNFLTVHETLKTFQNLYPAKSDLENLIHICQLKEFLDQYNDKISGGQKQRFLLALALINQPELIFLDEPSTGLDPQARRNLWEIVKNIKQEGKTIILTTHYMEEAQYLCDKIAIMDRGEIIAEGSPDQLIRKYCADVTVVLPKRSIEEKLNHLSMDYRAVHDRIEINTGDLNGCLSELMNNQIDLAELVVRSPNLEDVFLILTGRQLRD